MRRRYLVKIPGADGMLDRLEQRILADALRSAEHEPVVDLLLGSLYPLRQPPDDMVRVPRGVEDAAHVLDPRAGLGGVAHLDAGRPIEVEAGHALAAHPAAVDHQPVGNELRQAWAPGHLLNRPVLVEPTARKQGDDLALAALRLAVLVEHRHPRQAAVDARGWPDLAARHE